ncbi:MAG: hypothetical protein WDN75_07085 [Bacteroidota bacterium]
MQTVDTIIFDLGNVLIDWNPRYLFRKILKDEDEVTWFLDNVCTHEWNEKQDAGRTFHEATEELVGKFPELRARRSCMVWPVAGDNRRGNA